MDTDRGHPFATLLKGHRLAQGLSQEALAERTGLSREAIGRLERGERLSPRRDTVSLLAKALLEKETLTRAEVLGLFSVPAPQAAC